MSGEEKRQTRASVAAAMENDSTEPPTPFEDFVRTTLTSMSTKMDSLLAGQAVLEKRCENLETRVDDNSTKIDNVIESLKFESDQIRHNTSELDTIKKQVKEHEHQIFRSGQIIQSLETDLNNLQRYTRGFNVRILGVAEEEKEDCITKVENLLKHHFDVSGPLIENDHRTGKRTGGKPRHLIARFYSRATRRAVMAVARERLAETGVRITDDLTARDLEAKKRVIPLMNKLYTENQKPRFANGRLYSNGKLVPQETIDTFLSQLPGNWSPWAKSLTVKPFETSGPLYTLPISIPPCIPFVMFVFVILDALPHGTISSCQNFPNVHNLFIY